MAKNKNESNNENSGTLLTEKDGTQYFEMCIRDRKSSLSSGVPLASRNSRCLSGGTSCSNKVAFIIFKFAIGVFT